MQKNNSEFKRIAHRGASAEAPENTLAAIRLAVEKYRIDMVEIDIRLSLEGTPVVIHDETLERTTNGVGRVRNYRLEELKKFDAGFQFDPEGKGVFPYRGKGLTIPTLQEVLTQFPETPFLIEIKGNRTEIVKRLVEIIHRIPNQERLIVGSFNGLVMWEFRRRRPHALRSTFSRNEVIFAYLIFQLGFKKFYPPAHHVSIPPRELGFALDDPRWIHFLHRQKVRVYYWTIDEPSEMETLIKRGADGIMTNYPDRLNRVIGGSATRGTAPTGA